MAHPKWEWQDGMKCKICGLICTWQNCEETDWCGPDLDNWATKGILLGIAWEGLGPLTIGRAGGTKSGQISVAGTTVGRCLGACADTLEEALADIILQWWERIEEERSE